MASDVMTQAAAWAVFEHFLRNPSVRLLEEPDGLDTLFRRITDRDEISPRQWADGYLAAFAEGHRLALVTFDKALAARAPNSILLRA